MNRMCCLSLTLSAVLLVSGCGSIHNSIGSDKPVSDMRAEVEAPAAVTASDSALCVKPEMAEAQPEIVVAPAAPVPPFHARLYFILDTVEFIPESKAESQEIYQAILDRKPKEVTIVGHTDTAASNAYNEDLSLRRARKVRQELIDFGVSADIITIGAQGEYKLLINTPDETVEVKNRRVEIDAR